MGTLWWSDGKKSCWSGSTLAWTSSLSVTPPSPHVLGIHHNPLPRFLLRGVLRHRRRQVRWPACRCAGDVDVAAEWQRQWYKGIYTCNTGKNDGDCEWRYEHDLGHDNGMECRCFLWECHLNWVRGTSSTADCQPNNPYSLFITTILSYYLLYALLIVYHFLGSINLNSPKFSFKQCGKTIIWTTDIICIAYIRDYLFNIICMPIIKNPICVFYIAL